MMNVKTFCASAILSVALLSTGAWAAKEAAPTAFDPIAHQRVVEVSEQLRCLVILWLGPVALFIIGLGAFFVNLRRRKSTIAQGQQPLTSEEKAIAQRMLLGDKE